MNTRVLELLKNPDFLQAEDLKLLNDQIKSTPYVQNIRALFLLGTSRFDPENYKQVLSTTAAYTTDKKILYQLVNGASKPVQEGVEFTAHASELPSQESPEQNVDKMAVHDEIESQAAPVEQAARETEEHFSEEETVDAQESITSKEIENAVPVVELQPEKFTAITPSESTVPKPVYVNGELNRILFEGEENFLEQETPVIDKEASEESGQLVIADPKLSAPKIFSEESAPVSELAAKHEDREVIQQSPQETVPADNMPVAKTVDAPEIDNDETSPGDVSFHGIAPFLPEVKMAAAPQKVEKVVAPAPPSNKHEEEMQRLIAEVERKIKEKKTAQIKIEPVEVEENENSDISFNDTQEFVVAEEEAGSIAEMVDETASTEAKPSSPEKPTAEVSQSTPMISEDDGKLADKTTHGSTWKPMSVTLNTPDALLTGEKQPVNPTPSGSSESTAEIATSVKPAAEPVTDPVDSVVSEAANESETTFAEDSALDDSNVPQFINTWQNWLKIDRSPQALPDIPEEPEEDRKTVIIEKFIETAPRISQLREDGNFVVREKKGDISHLMTETLANIYIEQKLYAKAIHAFHILAEKHPHKADYFAGKVQEVRDLRSKIQ